MTTIRHEQHDELEEAALLQEAGHPLVFPLSRLPFQTQVPEVFAPIDIIAERSEVFFDERQNRG